MKIINCTWEIGNLGETTAEIIVSQDDRFEGPYFNDLIQKYQYVVVKIPMKRMDYIDGLSKMGFNLIEMQITVQKKADDLNYELPFYDDISFEELYPGGEILRIVNMITPEMFSTDRITLDVHYGPEIGMKRYVNWLKSEFISRRSQVAIVKYKNNEVGFMMFRIENDTFKLLLNGLYKHWQGKHLGLITTSSPHMYIKKNRLSVNMVETSISSNNVPVVKLYSRLGFEIKGQSYVFIKHCDA